MLNLDLTEINQNPRPLFDNKPRKRGRPRLNEEERKIKYEQRLEKQRNYQRIYQCEKLKNEHDRKRIYDNYNRYFQLNKDQIYEIRNFYYKLNKMVQSTGPQPIVQA
jgi:hypothetical protein